MRKLIFMAMLAVSLSGAARQHFCVNPYTGAEAVPNEAPALDVFVPADPAGPAVVICPGGGYTWRAYDNEGTNWVDFFNDRGITVAVLGYTLPEGRHELPARDVYQSLRYLRDNATRLGIDPEQIGAMGSSAGGHLVSTVATHYRTPEERPAFQILFYPLISMDPAITHHGSREHLIGNDAPYDLALLYSNEHQVKADNPPAYVVLTEDDTLVPVENSLRYFQALTDKKVPSELHIFPTGGHGFGSHTDFKYRKELLSTMGAWLDHTLKYNADK